MAEGARPNGWVPLAFLLPLLLVYLYLLRPGIAGVFYDDGIYLMGAKALATGHGYHLLSEAGEPAIIKYPPLFSALLSLIWMVAPGFPANLALIKGLNILLSLATLMALYLLGQKRFSLSPWVSALYCLTLGLNFYWVNITVEVFSEPLYLLLTSLVLALALDLYVKPPPRLTPRIQFLLLALSLLAFYTRTIALALMAGLFVWQWQQFGRQKAMLYLLGCLLGSLGWLLWVLNHPPSVMTANHFYSIPYNLGYLDELTYKVIQMRGVAPIAWGGVVSFGPALLRTVLPATMSWTYTLENDLMAFTWPGRLLGLLVLGVIAIPCVYRLKRFRSPMAWYALFYVVMVLLWPAHDQYPRLLMGVIPFLGLMTLGWLQGQGATKGMVALLLAICLSNVWPLTSLPRGERLAMGVKGLLWQDTQAAFSAIRTLPSETLIWGRYNGLYPLYTGRKVINRNVIGSAQAYPPGSTLEENRHRLYVALLGFLKSEHVEYLLLEPRVKGYWLHDLPESGMYQFVQDFPGVFEPVYTSPHGLVVLFKLHYEAMPTATR